MKNKCTLLLHSYAQLKKEMNTAVPQYLNASFVVVSTRDFLLNVCETQKGDLHRTAMHGLLSMII